ncbi:aminoacyl--tRNA ligase-related protein, partial [Variovorax paradoxus]|uniref:aminoacyl--tRNA ligase-related protein n=1 Tax=Variovorax paradoxus TaxID=34073 RepID=UPI0038D16065
YRDNMFTTESEKREYALKPMNCPGHVLIFKSDLRSYRDLPLRDWLLKLEAQRYAPAGPGTLAALRAEFRRLPWPARKAGPALLQPG